MISLVIGFILMSNTLPTSTFSRCFEATMRRRLWAFFSCCCPAASNVSQLNALMFAIDCIVTGFAFVFKLLYVEDAFRACALALLASLRPNLGTLTRALSTRQPVALANSLRLWRAAFRRTALSVVSDPAALSARYRFFHLRTFRSRARCIWLTSYWVYSLPLYSMFRAFSSCRLSSVQVGGSPSSGNTAKKVWRQFQPQSPAPVP